MTDKLCRIKPLDWKQESPNAAYAKGPFDLELWVYWSGKNWYWQAAIETPDKDTHEIFELPCDSLEDGKVRAQAYFEQQMSDWMEEMR